MSNPAPQVTQSESEPNTKEREWLSSFDAFDRAQKGALHISQVAIVVKCLNYNPSMDDLIALRKQFADDQGYVSKAKFILMMGRIDREDFLRIGLVDALEVSPLKV